MRPEELDSVMLTHLHFDHFADLIPFRYYLAYEARPPVPNLPLHLPPGASEGLRRVVEPVDPNPEFFSGTFGVAEYDPSGELAIGDLRLVFHKTLHSTPTFAVRISSVEKDGTALVFSADTGWLPSLVDFIRGADLFICEATWGAGEGNLETHLSGREAGRLAGLAGVPRLALSHVAEHRAPDAARAAEEEFDGLVEHARAGKIFRV